MPLASGFLEAPSFCVLGLLVPPGVAVLLAPAPLAEDCAPLVAGRGSLARGLEGRAAEPEEGCGPDDSPAPFPVGLGMRGEACPDFCPEVGLEPATDWDLAELAELAGDDEDEPAVPC